MAAYFRAFYGRGRDSHSNQKRLDIGAKYGLIPARHQRGTGTEMNTLDTRRRILDAVDAGFDAQLATTRDFVAIPSTRGAEGPCQDMMGDLLRARGYEVDRSE